MNNHDKQKNFDRFFETAIVGIGIIAMWLTAIVLAGIKLVELLLKYI